MSTMFKMARADAKIINTMARAIVRRYRLMVSVGTEVAMIWANCIRLRLKLTRVRTDAMSEWVARFMKENLQKYTDATMPSARGQRKEVKYVSVELEIAG